MVKMRTQHAAIDPTRRRVAVALAATCVGAALPAHAQHQHGPARRSLAIGADIAPDGDLWIVGLDTDRRLTLHTSGDSGRTWRASRVLDTGRDTIAADGEARPKIAFGPNGWVVIAYTQPLALPYTGEIRALRSADAGRTWHGPFTVHHDRQVITHRFQSLAFDATGALHVLWIDKRDAEAARRAAPTPAAAKTAYAGAAVYRTVSLDGGATFRADQRVAHNSCECCRIALAPTPEGGLAALWRHVYDGNVRDHAFARIAPRGESSSPAVRATFDGWKIDACPHHGPGLARAAGGGYHAVWFGDREGVAAARYTRLAADGAPVGDVRELPDAGAEHATLATAGETLAIVWRSFDGKVNRLRALVSTDAGRSFETREIAQTAGDNDHPLLVRKGAGLMALWRTQEEVIVEKLA